MKTIFKLTTSENLQKFVSDLIKSEISFEFIAGIGISIDRGFEFLKTLYSDKVDFSIVESTALHLNELEAWSAFEKFRENLIPELYQDIYRKFRNLTRLEGYNSDEVDYRYKRTSLENQLKITILILEEAQKNDIELRL